MCTRYISPDAAAERHWHIGRDAARLVKPPAMELVDAGPAPV
jgi:hypothetical protein